MPRIPRMYLKTEFFHVITQGINKSYIFNSEKEIKFYIKRMYQLQKECNVKVISYCIMNNHAHILIKASEINNMSNYMHRLNTTYACYYNKIHKRVGYVFRDRFKSEGIYSENQLYNCIKYIYDNPVKAGICDRPELYKFSNYKEIGNVSMCNEYYFLDDVEENKNLCSEIIEKYLLSKKINIDELKSNQKELKNIIIILKKNYNISLRNIAMNLNMNREKVRKIYNE